MIEKMNKLLANLNVMYVKLHNYHYDIVGIDFYVTHKFLEAEYDKFHEWIDVIAEQIRVKAKFPMASMKEYLKVATIKEADSKAISSKEIYQNLWRDYSEIAKQIWDLKEEVDDALNDILNDILNEIQVKIWFYLAFIE